MSTTHSECCYELLRLVFVSLLLVQLEVLASAAARTGLLSNMFIATKKKKKNHCNVGCYLLSSPWLKYVCGVGTLILVQSPKTCKDLRRLWCPKDKTSSFSLQQCTSKHPKQPCTSARSDVSVCGEDKLESDWHYLPTFPQFVFLVEPVDFPIPRLSCSSLEDLNCVCLAFRF